MWSVVITVHVEAPFPAIFQPCVCSSKWQCDPVVRTLALRSGDPGFKTRCGHWLNLFLVVPGSISQLHL